MTACPAHLIAPGLPGYLGVRSQFSLASFMAGQSDGLWYDFTKTDRLFQENTGPTAVASTNDVIGLALDQRTWRGQTLAQVLAGATNLTPAGGWSMSTTGGTATATESPSGQLNLTGDGSAFAIADKSFTTVVGAWYRIEATVATNIVSVRAGTTQGGVGNLAATNLPAGSTTALYFQATATTTWVRFSRSASGTSVVTAISCKLVPGYAATQATSSLRGTYQTTGDKFDGSDDNLLTGYLAGSGANFIVALVTVPASLAATQVVCGASETAANRFYFGFTTAGLLRCAIGSDSAIDGATDLRGQTVVVGMSCNGSNVATFNDASIAVQQAQNGSPTTSVASRLGALNTNTTASAFFSGSIKKLVAGRQFLDLPTYLKIRNALLAA